MPSSVVTPIEHIVKYISGTLSWPELRPLSQDEWETIVVTAIALGLAPLLHKHFESANVALPPMALAKLSLTRQAHARRNEAIAGQLSEVLAACAAAKVDVLVLKGALLAPTVYDEAALRPMNDIDLLFRPQDLAKVAHILESLGYTGKHKDAAQGPGVTKHLSTYRRLGNEGSTPNPYLSAGGDRMIEPHCSLEESWFGLKIDITPGVWQRAVPISLHGQSAHRLATNDLVLHLTVHAVFHVIMGTAVFLQLYDIGQVLKVWSAEIDWFQLLILASQAKAQPFLYAGLYWARQLYQVALPEAPLVALKNECPPHLVAHIQRMDASTIFNRTQQPPLVTLKQQLQRGLLDRWETARWAGSLPAKWKVWQTALAFYKTDTANLLQKRLKAQA